MDIDIMIEAIGGIDASIIDEVLAEGHKMKNVTVFAKRSLLKWAAVAAAIVVIAAGTLPAVKTLYSFNNGNLVNPGSSSDSGDSGIVSPVDGDSEHSSKPDNENNPSSEESGSGKEPVNSAAEAQNKPGEHDQTEAPKPDDAVSGTVFVGLNKVYCGNPTELFPYIEIESIEDVYLSAITSSGKTLDDVDGIVREMVGTTFEITLAEKTEHAVDKAITLLTKDARVKYAGQEQVVDDRFRWSRKWNFGINGYVYNRYADNMTACFIGEDWSWAFDGINARLELDGKPFIGRIEANTAYTLVISLKYSPFIDSFYKFSTLKKEDIKVGEITASDYYVEDEYCVAKFELPKLNPAYEYIDFALDNYVAGEDVSKLVLTTPTEGVEILNYALMYKEKTEDNSYTNVEGAIGTEIEYMLFINVVVPEGKEVSLQDTAYSLKLTDNCKISKKGCSAWVHAYYGRDIYMIAITLPSF